jgi:hypothetical protein
MLQKHVPYWFKDTRFHGTEVGENEIERLACVGFILVVPIRLYHPRLPATCSAFNPNKKKFSSPASSAISMVASSRVPIVSAPFIMNFMLLVPLAS